MDYVELQQKVINISALQRNTIETLHFLCLNERNVSLVTICHLAMQRLSSEATTSCLNRDAPGLPEHDQRAAISFFQWSSNQ